MGVSGITCTILQDGWLEAGLPQKGAGGAGGLFQTELAHIAHIILEAYVMLSESSLRLQWFKKRDLLYLWVLLGFCCCCYVFLLPCS